METKANYVVIGLLTLVTIMGGFGFVFWLQHSGGVGDRTFYRVVFDGPAQGLRTGAAVLFNGIRVGEVTDLRLNPQNPRRVQATISVAVATPVRTDTQASLNYAGLTGIASLSLKGGAPNAPALVAKDGETAPVIAVDPEAAQDIAESARDVLQKINTVVIENQESIRAAVKNIDAFTAVLAKNSERFDHILAGLDGLVAGTDGKPGEISEAVKSFQTLAENLDKRTAELTADGRRTLSTLERAVRNFDRNPQRLIFGNPSAPAPPGNR
jgi:phospholipid/cholesterol/gamma-HCH transport system substrate-binding protein